MNALALASTTTPTQVLVNGRQPVGYTNIEHVNVTQVAPVVLFQGDLLITGTNGNDRIIVSMNLARTDVLVRINGLLVATVPLADITGRIIVNALDGNDMVLVGAAVPVGADISGGDGRDRLTGGPGHDRIDGGNGNDTINGGAGNDTLVVSAGLDVLAGAAGADTVQGPDASAGWVIGAPGIGRVNVDTLFMGVENLAGATGNDTFTVRPLGSVKGTVDGGSGVNALDYSLLAGGVRVSLAGGFATRTGGVANIVNVLGGAGADMLVGDGQANVLTGNGGRNILIGGGGADSLIGGAGDDVLIGGSTTHDGSDAALQSLSAEWRRPISYAKRVDHLTRELSGGLNGANVLTATTVVNDGGAIDSLFESTGSDWFITYAGDNTDVTVGETVTAL